MFESPCTWVIAVGLLHSGQMKPSSNILPSLEALATFFTLACDDSGAPDCLRLTGPEAVDLWKGSGVVSTCWVH